MKRKDLNVTINPGGTWDVTHKGRVAKGGFSSARAAWIWSVKFLRVMGDGEPASMSQVRRLTHQHPELRGGP